MRRALCEVCDDKSPYSQSPLCFECLKDAQLIVEADGTPLKAFDDGRGRGRRLYAARYRFRAVRCGKKDCKPCANKLAHYWYVYRQWRSEGKARDEYLGPAEELGSPYELPQLRAPLTSWRRSPKR